MLEFILGKKIKEEIPYNVGEAKIKIISKNKKTYYIPVKGFMDGMCISRDRMKYVYFPKTVEDIFNDFIKESKTGVIKVSEDLGLGPLEIKSIKLVERQDHFVFKTITKRVRN